MRRTSPIQIAVMPPNISGTSTSDARRAQGVALLELALPVALDRTSERELTIAMNASERRRFRRRSRRLDRS